VINQDKLEKYYQEKDSIYFQSEREDMLPYVPGNCSMLLEIGCGYGNFGKLVKQQRFAQVWGVELDKDAAAIANQRLDKVICGTFDRNTQLPHNSFDCIVFNDVLEHLVDPFDTLLYAKELLTEDGVIVASIPNVRYFQNVVDFLIYRNWEYTEQGILDKTHLRFFTYRSIISTFTKLGYEIKTIEGIHPIDEMRLPNRFRYLNWVLWLLRKKIDDMRYLHFAVVAHPKSVI